MNRAKSFSMAVLTVVLAFAACDHGSDPEIGATDDKATGTAEMAASVADDEVRAPESGDTRETTEDVDRLRDAMTGVVSDEALEAAGITDSDLARAVAGLGVGPPPAHLLEAVTEERSETAPDAEIMYEPGDDSEEPVEGARTRVLSARAAPGVRARPPHRTGPAQDPTIYAATDEAIRLQTAYVRECLEHPAASADCDDHAYNELLRSENGERATPRHPTERDTDGGAER